MATTTTNYGFDIPQSTDLVKDGATAIATLGQDIDTAMNTALGTKKAGMVLLNTTSFSGVSSFSLPANTFTSTYDRYLILLESIGSTTGGIQYRMRLSGTDNTATEYATQSLDVDTTSVAAYRNAKATSGTIGQSATNTNINEILLFNPATTKFTMSFARSAFYGLIKFVHYSTAHEVATAFDSMTIFPASGTFTGFYSVYGFNK
jgi:hypothetical protein